jgi:hypothetical protein
MAKPVDVDIVKVALLPNVMASELVAKVADALFDPDCGVFAREALYCAAKLAAETDWAEYDAAEAAA